MRTVVPASSPGSGAPTRDESALLRRIVTMCGHMSALASQSVDIATIAQLLFDDIGAAVAVLDRGLEVVTAAGVPEPQEFVAALRGRTGAAGLNTVLAAAARNRRALTVPTAGAGPGWVVVAPICVGDGVAAYLVTAGSRDHELNDNLRLMVIEHAAMICGVVLSRDLVLAAAAGRARQQLFDGLLLARDRDEEELERWARHVGLEPGRDCQVATFTLPAAQRAGGLVTLESILTRLAPDAVVVARTDEVVAIFPVGAGGAVGAAGRAANGVPGRADGGRARGVAEQCLTAVTSRGLGPVAAGIGTTCRTPADIARSYAEARHALAASERMGDFGGITTFADLGIQRLFLRVPDVADLRAFADEVVGPAGTELLATLAVYFEENGSLQRAAKRLHVHPNTVTYRIRKVEEVSGLSLDVHRDRLMAEVAVEILTTLGGRR